MSAQSFGNYQLVKKLATGGMAEVWLAKQTGIEGFNRHVVVKRILPHLAEDPEFVQMFLNEARIASRFNHPNIGQIYDLGEKDGQYFIAMEFIHGEDLGRVMRRAWSTGQWVARHIALRIVADACAGLYYAHTRNDDQGRPLKVVHRDISPQNILISFDGAVKVLDFGIAKASDQVSNTKSGAIKGKFAYMAPEQAAGKPLDARSDIFALGLVLYELVTGVRPLKRDSELATLQAALECAIDPPSAVAEIPPELDGVVMRALAKSPDDRYADAREFQRALESFLLNAKELSTSAEVSELMAALFADRLNEEARLGTPNPATESSTSNPVASSYSAASAPQQATPGPSAPRGAVRASPALTIDQEDAEGGEGDDGGAVALGGGYELPAGTVLPTRAYSAQKGRNEETKASMPDVEPVQSPPPPRRKTVSRPAAANDEASPAAAPRRPSQLVQRKTGSGMSMPEAPPRSKSRTANAAAQRPSEVALDKFVDLKGLKEKQSSRLKALVSVILLLAAVGGIVVFKDRLLAMLNKTALATDGTPVLLTVTSNPATEVMVMPGPTAKGRKPQSLGRTPITEQSGAFIGDIVVLKNPDRGLYFEVPVVSKEANPSPNTLIVIDKTFREVGVRVRVKPSLRDAEIYRGELKAGVPNIPLNLMPGLHKLEIRSNQLADPCPFEVRIQDGSSSIDWTVDVTPCLKKK